MPSAATLCHASYVSLHAGAIPTPNTSSDLRSGSDPYAILRLYDFFTALDVRYCLIDVYFTRQGSLSSLSFAVAPASWREGGYNGLDANPLETDVILFGIIT